jgi:hypothetical protein
VVGMTNAHEPSEQLRAAAHRLTHPDNTAEAYAEAVAERFQVEHPAANGRLVRFAATLRALLAYFEANPDVPVPHYVSLHAHADDVERLVALAAARGAAVYGPAERPQTHFDALGAASETSAVIVITTPAPDRPL